MGGFTEAMKVAAWCEAHGPVDRLRVDAVSVVADRDGVVIEHVRQVC